MRLVLAICGALASTALLTSAALAAEYDCAPTYSASAYGNATQKTSSKQFVALPGLTGTIPTGANKACAYAHLSAQVKAPAPGGVSFRLTIDGNPVGLPRAADFQTAGNKPDERFVTFIVPKLQVDDMIEHTVGIEYSSTDGSEVTVSRALLTLFYVATLN